MEWVKKYNKKHHSIIDWNFYDTNYALDTNIYISEPSSLRFKYRNYALLKQASVGGPIPEGIIETYVRYSSWTSGQPNYPFIFRNQASDGTVNINNTYIVYLWTSTPGVGYPFDKARFIVIVGGTTTIVEEKSISPALYPDTWYLLRVKFWVYQGVLMVAFEYWDDSQWVKLCADFSDPNNRWATSSVNRVGIGGLYPQSPYYTWVDNTRIFRRVS